MADFQRAEERERAKAVARAMANDKMIETFRFHGITLADMDRAELLGVICFLINDRATAR